MRKTDSELKQAVETELRWDSKVDSDAIRVDVDLGAVTLYGVVDTYSQKWAAERATRRVDGVTAIVQDIVVQVLSAHIPSDLEIGAAVRRALNWDVFTPESIVASVHDGAVILDGEVSWAFERDAAERAIRNLHGVVAVRNNVVVRPKQSQAHVLENLKIAFGDAHERDRRSIQVDVAGGVVTLSGHASTLQAIEDAVAAARGAVGVTEVIDRVMIEVVN